MFTPRKFELLILSVVLALAAGLAFTGPAYAQEGAPQPPAAVGDETLTPPPPPPPGDSLAGLSGGDDLSTPLLPPPPPDLSSVTSGLAASGVTLMDEEDHPLPVISQSVADGAFPWIRVGTTIHYFATDCTGLTGNCHQDPNPVQGAVEYIIEYGILPTDRAIHIDGSPDQYDGAVSINGTTNAILKQLNRLEGGCNRGTGLCDTSDPTQTAIKGSVSVIGTLAGFTLQGLTIKGGVTFTGNAGALTVRNVVIEGGTEGGLNVTGQSGPVTIEGVRVANAPNTGIFINNSAAIAPVTITGSESGNTGDLAGEIITRGPVMVIGSMFHHGGKGGLKITTTAPLTVRSSQFNDHLSSGSSNLWDGTGLYATASTILIDGARSGNNRRYGFALNATGAISMLNSKGENNTLAGLMICKDGDCASASPAAGAVTLSNSNFSNNGENGAVLNKIGPLSISSTILRQNGRSGLWISTGSPITLNGIRADENVEYGAWLDLCQYDAVLGRCSSSAGLTMLNTAGWNNTNKNGSDGLKIQSGGFVTLNGLDAASNANGIKINNNQTLGMPGVTMNRVYANDNRVRGVDIQTRGPVTWVQGAAERNGNDPATADGDGGGVYIVNTLGFAPVNLTDLSINGNQKGDGLRVISLRAITLTRVSAGNNSGTGALLNNAGGSAIGGVTIVGNVDNPSWFGENGANGLVITSRGAILLSNLNVVKNGSLGASINNQQAPANLPVMVTNIGANENLEGGIKITTRGAITITNIDAGQNNGFGAWLDNKAGAGPVTINRTLPLYHNWFGNNKGFGLRIEARGQVTLNRIAVDNTQSDTLTDPNFIGHGVWVDNCLWDEASGKCLGAGGVILNTTPGWDNNFNRNAGVGLHVQSGGAITIVNVKATDNGLEGVVLDNNWDQPPFAVTINSIGGTLNSFERNGLSGLAVFSSGAITARNLQSFENNGHGANLYNGSALFPQPVTVTIGTFNNNRNGFGLRVRSKGPVTLTGVEAQNNDMHETFLDVDTYIDNRVQMTGEANADVFLLNRDTLAHTFTLTPDFTATLRLERFDAGTSTWQLVKEISGSNSVTLTETFSADVEYRLLVIGNDLANGNGYRLVHNSDDFVIYVGSGVFVDTSYESANGPVKIISLSPNSSNFGGNASNGLVIYARGAVSLNRISAEGNGGNGVLIDNCLWNSVKNVCSVTAGVVVNGANNNFNNNRYGGIEVFSGGAISVDNINARGNGGTGVLLTNQNGIGGVTVNSSSLTDSNGIFQNNAGLHISSRGAIVVNDTLVFDNRTDGGYLSNSNGAGSVIVNGSIFAGNGGSDADSGLSIFSKGAVSLNGVIVNGNRGNGAYIRNSYSGTPQPVTILRSEFNNNQSATFDGLTVQSKGVITLNNVQATDNKRAGATLDNCLFNGTTCTANAPIFISGTLGENIFFNNGADGLLALSNTNITAMRIRASGNGKNLLADKGDGAYMLSFTGNISITDGVFEHNWLNGVFAIAAGDIALSGVNCFSNSFDITPPPANLDTLAGAHLNAGKNVRVINSHFNGNAEYGLRYHKGTSFTFTWIGSTASGNNFEGAGAINIQAF